MDSYVRNVGGVSPYGYSWNAGVLEINKWERNIVLLIFKYALKDNLSPHKISQMLNEHKLNSSRKGKMWTYKTVSYLFAPERIKFYSGYTDNKRGNWEPIITTEMAAELIRKKIVTTSGKRPHIHKYLLTGIGRTVCGYCGGNITSVLDKTKSGVNRYYYCSTRGTYGSTRCGESKTFPMSRIDEIILRTIETQISNITEIEKWTSVFYKKRDRQIKTKLDILDKKISASLKDTTNAKSSSSSMASRNRISDLMIQKEKLIEEKLDYYNFAQLTGSQIERLHLNKQKELVIACIKRIQLFNDKIIIDFPFIINKSGRSSITKEY